MTTTLLAVDDSKTMRKVIEITFSGEDFRMLLCATADEALGKLSDRPQVALVDAGLDGYELCRRLKAAQPGLPVLILSNKQQPYDRALGGQVGADDFADKPFDTQQLLDKVNALAKKSAGAAAPAPAPAPAAQPSPPRAPTLQYGANPAPAPAPAPVAAPAPLPSPPLAAISRQTAPGMAPAGATFSRAPTLLHQTAPPEAARPAPMTSPSAPPPPVAAVAAAVASNGADFAQKLGSLGLTQEQVQAVLSLSREVVERVVWEVVPTLAETIIREEIQRLTRD